MFEASNLPWSKILMIVALLLALAIIVRVLVHRDRSATSKINLEDFLLGEDGKASKAAGFAWGAFGMTTWMMVFLALRDKMTEGYFAAYLATWVAPTLTKLVKGPPSVQESVTVETSSVSSQTTVKP